MKNLCVLFAILATSIMLFVGCAGPGVLTRTSVTMPNGEKVTVVAHKQKAPDWLLSRNKLALNYVVKGDVTKEQLAAVSYVEMMGRIHTGIVRPNSLVYVLSNGVIYYLAGGAGVGLGSMAFPNSIPRQYMWYGAAASGVAGLANGLITLGGQTYTFQVFGMQFFSMHPSYGVQIIIKSPY